MAKTDQQKDKTADQQMDTAKPKKQGWREKAVGMLTQRRTGGKTISQAQIKDLAEKRGGLLTAQLSAARSGRTQRPSNRVKDMEFELNAIINGTWTPGMKRPNNKEITEAMRSIYAIGQTQSSPDAARLDSLITS